MAVTPIPGLVSAVAVGGTAVTVVAPNPAGGFITNPASAADQGLGAAESLYVNPIGAATLTAIGTTFEIPPGGSWPLIAGQTTPTSVNAVSAGHRFSVISLENA